MTKIHMQHLQDIVDLCENNDVKLVITRTPTATAVYENLDEFDNYVKCFANDNSIDYINFDEFSEQNLDCTDFKDIGHLNNSGASKISEHIGNYTKELLKLN